jgi:hypothetical protein
MECFCRNTRPELLYVALQIRSDEALPESEAIVVRRGKKAVWKSSS